MFTFRNVTTLTVALILVIFVGLLNVVECKRKIVGGKYATAGQFPFIVQVKLFESAEKEGTCTGQIIDKDWVLTAGHCQTYHNQTRVKPSAFKIIAGMTSLDNPDTGNQTVHGSETFLHEKYFVDNEEYVSLNDISLIKLDKSLIFNEYVDKIKLDARPWISGTSRACKIAGWGRADDGTDTVTRTLKYANVKAMQGKKDCPCIHDEDRQANMLCIPLLGMTRTGTCFGDSGGPLICDGQLTGTVRGNVQCPEPTPGQTTPKEKEKNVTHSYEECLTEDFYPDFMFVCQYLDWIRAKTGLDESIVPPKPAHCTHPLADVSDVTTTTSSPINSAAVEEYLSYVCISFLVLARVLFGIM